MQLNICIIDSELSHTLNKTEKNIGYVHSIYSKVINISFEDSSKLFSIAIDQVIQSPYMMRTEEVVKFITVTKTVEVGDPVVSSGLHQLRIGIFVIDWSSSSIWNKKLSTKKVNKKIINHHSMVLAKALQKTKENNQMIQALFSDNTNKIQKNHFQRKYVEILTDFDRSLDSKKLSELIGLGIGLTPSGDDFFIGFFTVLYVYNHTLIKEIMKSEYFSLENIHAKTTQISYNMIIHGLQGRVNDELYHLVMSEEGLEKRIRNIQKIGSTSGNDMLAGVYYGYRLLLNNYE